LENIKTKWLPEIIHHLPNCPRVLVGTKKDMRDQSKNKVSPQDGEQFAKENKFTAYCECSAKVNDGLKEVFDTAIRVVLEEKNKKPPAKKGCLLL
jgi:Ras-related C3 botulinum toxin substrate 1